jgi:hypothetical protein
VGGRPRPGDRRAEGVTVTVPDGEYAELSLTMRTGEQPGEVFDTLTARGQITVHPSEAARTAALAQIAVAEFAATRWMAIVADTREQAADLNAAIRDELIAAGRVDDQHTTTTAAGQRIGAGDRITTRRNHRGLDVANRDTWTVDRHGGITATGAHGSRTLPGDYVRRHVELAYAATIHAVQGDTANSGHLVLGEHTGAAAAYVGMTRGRTNNTAHLVADTLDQAREQWITAFSHDRADLGPAHAADLAAAEAERYAPHRPLQEALAELHHTWTLEQDCLDQLVSDRHRRDQLRHIIAVTAERDAVMPPLEAAHHAARLRADQAAERFAQVAAAVDAHACHIADHLHRTWDSQRPAARAAAHTVRAGPGASASTAAPSVTLPTSCSSGPTPGDPSCPTYPAASMASSRSPPASTTPKCTTRSAGTAGESPITPTPIIEGLATPLGPRRRQPPRPGLPTRAPLAATSSSCGGTASSPEPRTPSRRSTGSPTASPTLNGGSTTPAATSPPSPANPRYGPSPPTDSPPNATPGRPPAPPSKRPRSPMPPEPIHPLSGWGRLTTRSYRHRARYPESAGNRPPADNNPAATGACPVPIDRVPPHVQVRGPSTAAQHQYHPAPSGTPPSPGAHHDQPTK